MSLQDIAKPLKGAIKADGSLDFTGALVGSPAISKLIEQLYSDGTVTIAGAKVDLASDQKSLTVSGKADLVKVKGSVVTIVLTEGAGSALDMVFKLALADGWAMIDLFPILPSKALSSLVIDSADLLLTTQVYDDPGTGKTLQPGLNLAGAIALAKTLSYLEIILGKGKTLPLAGPISDFQLPLFSFDTAPITGTLGSVTIDQVSLEFASVNLTEGQPDPTALGQISLSATLEIENIVGQVHASLPSDASELNLSVDFQGLNLKNFVALSHFIGDTDPFKALPGPVLTEVQKVGGAFSLTHLGFDFDLQNPGFKTVDLDVVVDLQGFKIFSIIIELAVKELDLSLSVNNGPKPAQVTFGASADIQIGSNAMATLITLIRVLGHQALDDALDHHR